MDIWATRKKSLAWLDSELNPECNALQKGFEYLDAVLELFQEIGSREGESQIGTYCRICSITLSKFNHLLLGSYSLSLDGLAQEAGALLRPLLETYELLVYFRQDISRVNEVIDHKLPSAGTIGKRISGNYQDLREHLNKNASHFSYQPASMQHLFGENAKIKTIPSHTIGVFRTNIQVINALQRYMLFESINCLFTIGFNATSLANDIEKWHTETRNLLQNNGLS